MAEIITLSQFMERIIVKVERNTACICLYIRCKLYFVWIHKRGIPVVCNGLLQVSNTYRLYDMRAPHSCSSQASNFLIDLRGYGGSSVECRCIAIHPARPELIAVGVNDPFIRIFDRRMIKKSSSQVSWSSCLDRAFCCLIFAEVFEVSGETYLNCNRENM